MLPVPLLPIAYCLFPIDYFPITYFPTAYFPVAYCLMPIAKPLFQQYHPLRLCILLSLKSIEIYTA